MRFGLVTTRAILLAAILLSVLAVSSCLPVTSGEVQIGLSEAISLSKSSNISSVVIDPNRGVMTMTAAVSEGTLKIVDVDGKAVDVKEGQ